MVGEDPNQVEADAEVDEAQADKGIEDQEVIQTDLERKGLREKIRERIEERRQYNESKRERKDQHNYNKKSDKQRMKESRKRAWNSVKEFGDEHNVGGMVILGLAAEFIVLFVYGGGTVAMNTNGWLITNLFIFFFAVAILRRSWWVMLTLGIIQWAGFAWGVPYLQMFFEWAFHAELGTVYLLTLPAMYPLWLVYGLYKTNSKLTKWTFIIYFSFMVILFLGMAVEGTINVQKFKAEGAEFDPVTAGDAAKGVLRDIVDLFDRSIKGGGQLIENRIAYATGGLYVAEVDEGAEQPLGVYIEEVKPALPRFYEDKNVVLWAKIRGMALKDPLPVKFSCSAEVKQEEGDPIVVEGTIKPAAEKTFFNDTTTRVGCWFDPGTFETGKQRIKFMVEYKFRTYSYLKRHFVKGTEFDKAFQDPSVVFETYGIRDKSPNPEHTQGPITLSSKTDDYLIPVYLSGENIWAPMLEMGVQNKWEGQLKELTNLEVTVPIGFDLNLGLCLPEFYETTPKDGRTRYNLTKSITEDLDKPRIFMCGTKITSPSAVFERDGQSQGYSYDYFFVEASYIYYTEVEEKVQIVTPLDQIANNNIPVKDPVVPEPEPEVTPDDTLPDSTLADSGDAT